MKHFYRTITFFLGIILLSVSASGEDNTIIVQYLTGTADPQPGNVADGVEAATLAAKQKIPLVTGFSEPNNNAYYLLNNSEKGAPLLPESKADALDGDSCFEFMVVPKNGLELELSHLTLDVGHEGSRTLLVYLVVVAEIDEERYEENVLFGALSYYDALPEKSGAGELPATGRVNLKKLPKDITAPVVFRIYAYYEILKGTSIPSGYTNSIRIGNISLAGECREQN